MSVSGSRKNASAFLPCARTTWAAVGSHRVSRRAHRADGAGAHRYLGERAEGEQVRSAADGDLDRSDGVGVGAEGELVPAGLEDLAVAVAAQGVVADVGFGCHWHDGARRRRHAPDYFVRLADGRGRGASCGCHDAYERLRAHRR
ncbi:hypothetical protein GT350_34235 [Streptomyces sp. SID1034]|nr:hypothetical protein [Streptomyces sp. SID1034]